MKEGFQTPEEARECGELDAMGVQRKMDAEGIDNPYMTPEEAMQDLENVADDEIWAAYYRGYLSRWD